MIVHFSNEIITHNVNRNLELFKRPRKRTRTRHQRKLDDLCICQRGNKMWPYSNSPCVNLSFNQTRSLTPLTPLTGRRYLKDKDPTVTPVSTATQSVSRLQQLLSGRRTVPSEALLEIFE